MNRRIFTCLIGAIAIAAWPHRTPGYPDCAAVDFAGSRVTATRALVAAIATTRVMTRVSETSDVVTAEAAVATKASVERPMTDRRDQLGVDQAQPALAGIGSVDAEPGGDLADPATSSRGIAPKEWRSARRRKVRTSSLRRSLIEAAAGQRRLAPAHVTRVVPSNCYPISLWR